VALDSWASGRKIAASPNIVPGGPHDGQQVLPVSRRVPVDRRPLFTLPEMMIRDPITILAFGEHGVRPTREVDDGVQLCCLVSAYPASFDSWKIRPWPGSRPVFPLKAVEEYDSAEATPVVG